VAFALGSTSAVVNAIVLFIQPPEVDGAEEDIPRLGREWLEADPPGGQEV
jgi:hypothetical protein